MTVETVVLPDLGEGVVEAELLQWLVDPGDDVTEDQPLAEVETDKAVIEVPAPMAGTVQERHAEAGNMVPVGTPLVALDVGDEGDEADGTSDEPEETPATEAAERPIEGGEPSGSASVATAAERSRAFAPPRTRRLARELGVDPSRVAGTGERDRVTDADVRRASEKSPQDRRPTPRALSATATPVLRERDERAEPTHRESATTVDRASAAAADVTGNGAPTTEEETVSGGAETAEPESEVPETAQESGIAPGDRLPVEDVPAAGGRSGASASASAFAVPHTTHADEVDVTTLVDVRADLEPYAEVEGIDLTELPFVLRAVTLALREFPRLNASIDESQGEIVCHDTYDLGVATATDAGLSLPVIDAVDGRGLLDLASETATKLSRAREGHVADEESPDCTFTVTDIGAVAGTYATPPVVRPTVATLALGRIESRPRVVDGEVVARQTLPLSLSVDPRVVDGAVAARFLDRVARLLATPTRLL
ncbi:dihydrolipoamide acetyltransferase family protein [Haloplanus halobius]|uniref:dihydrolipoamide acetyltransferase family protein n=1 Tax=Haloplanus halobius TaxID=2934938 RepID=UPI002010A93D|nr:dihydrolipoamide acetyltransferase family protein [Haloplanus sp. XH21]